MSRNYRPWSDAEKARLRQLSADGRTIREIADALGRSWGSTKNMVGDLRCGLFNQATGAVPDAPPRNEALEALQRGKRTRQTGDTADVEMDVPRFVETEADAMDAAGIDGAVWEAVGLETRHYQLAIGDGQVQQATYIKLRLKRRPVAISDITGGIIDALKDRIKPLPPLARPASDSGYLFVATMGEPHLGKLAWAPETGESYDLPIALDRVRQSHRHLMQRARAIRPERVALIIGDDFFTADGPQNQTAAGTPQEVDGRYRKVHRAGLRLCREIIESWRQIAPVSVWMKPGNHDTVQTWHLGEVLAAIYEPTDDVEVINPDRLRWYRQWGTCLIGLTHGDKESDGKLPMLMASEAKREWAETTHRVWLTGHLHTLKARATRMVIQPTTLDVNEEFGVVTRRCRSLSGTDAWHHGLGYVGNVKAAEGFAFHRVLGETDVYTAAIPVEQFGEAPRAAA